MISKHKSKWDLLGTGSRYFIITGGRASGKSFEVSRFLTLLSYEQHQKILYTRKTMVSTHLSVIPEFIEKAKLLGLDKDFDVLKSSVTNKTNSSHIDFKGLQSSNSENTANLKSISGYTTWVLEEAEELHDELAFDMLNLSFRSRVTQNRIILILNPTTKQHWIYKKFFQDMGVESGFTGIKGDTTYIHSTYLDNYDNLAQSFLDEVGKMKVNNPGKYNNIILGGWLDKSEGVIFNNWEYGPFNPNNLQTIYGEDFGYSVDPDTLVEVAIDNDNKVLYVKECIYQKGLSTTALTQMVKGIVGDKVVIPDCSQPRLIQDIRSAGVNILNVSKNPIETGITRMLDYKIIVEPNSLNIGKELNNYSYSNKSSKLYNDSWNHAIDAMRYAIEYLLDNKEAGQYYTIGRISNKQSWVNRR